ncbi:MAG: outer membrane lipoprotein carrier protein LolA [Deltaproteobacteria bacterium]|jgi:outer membrane lipoprotein-sorting protein|nr:outer membrane lipoprotein carrier protein LolA [Deltaproteobacteria bacterium]
MKKIFFIILMFSFISPMTWAADLNSQINAIESANKAWTDISAIFRQSTRIVLLNKTIAKSGTLKLKKGGKLYISYSKKGEKSYISDGSTIWIFVPGDITSLQTYAASKGNMPKEALSFLSGFGKLRKEFKISESSEFKKVGEGMPLHLIPRNKSVHYKSLDALFGKDGLLKELIINNASGNISHYKFSKISTNRNIPDSLFNISTEDDFYDPLPQ